MQDHTEAPIQQVASEATGRLWLTHLRPLEVCAFAGALGFIAYRFF